MTPVYYLLRDNWNDDIEGVFSTWDKAEQYIIHNDLDAIRMIIEEVSFHG